MAATHPKTLESGKFNSILAYLDDVSENLPDNTASRRHVPQRIDMAASISAPSSEPLGLRPFPGSLRLQHTQQQQQQQSSYRGGDGRERGKESRPGTNTRAPWDSSIKQAATTTLSNSSGMSTSRAGECKETGGGGREGSPTTAVQPSTPTRDGTTVDIARSRHRRYESPSDRRLDNGNPSSRSGRSDSYEGVPADYDSTTRGGGGETTVESQRRRWVWDEWNVDSSACDRERSGRGEDGVGKQPFSSRQRANTALLSTQQRGRHDRPTSAAFTAISTGSPCTLVEVEARAAETASPAARQAFEDVQSTARNMREDLKERRSEVLELKTSLQRVRASNERRRVKLSERWASRAAAAAAEREGAAERQRAFGRQLEKDVDALEEKLAGLERQVGRFREGRDRDCALARAECAKELKKAREVWMSAEKGRLQRMSEKKAGAIKEAAVRALEPQLSELVKSNRTEARLRAEDLETALLGLQAKLERESTEKVQAGAREYQASLEDEAEEERRQAEHQLGLLARSNEADSQEFREAARRDLEGERVRFEAGRKRAREAAAKEVGGAKAAEADRAALTLAEHARELRETEEAYRREEDETRRRLAEETERWQRQVLTTARKEADDRDGIRKGEARAKCNEELEIVLTRLEAEATQAREASRSEAQRVAAETGAVRARELTGAQELETKAMERYLGGARRQAELEAETKGLEQDIKATEERTREEAERLAAAERQAEEGRERWRSRLDRLQEDCSTERASAREEVSKLLAGSEDAEGTAGRASGEMEEASAALRASLTAEFAQVDAKVAAVLKKKSEQADDLRKRLDALQAQTKAREEELSDHRRRTFS